MNTAEFFFKGLMVGFLIAAPVGPVAVMCLHRTIAHGRLAGYVCGLGATVGDTIFGAIAAFGLGFIATELVANQLWLRWVGGVFLIVLGLKLALSRHLTRRAEAQEREEEREEGQSADAPPAPQRQGLEDHIANFASSFAVMITNPITLVAFAAIFATIDIGEIGEKTRWGLSLVAGVFAGGALWWTILITVASLCRHRINEQGILWVNRGSGALILVFGVVILFFPELLPEGAAAAARP
jgi:threonine/homoserine/homoserine lactone efflux protein